MSLGERLRKGIEAAGLSVRAFHREMDALGVPGSSYPNIHRYLADNSEPALGFLREAATLLGVRHEWLAVGQGGMTEEEERARSEAVEAAQPAGVTDFRDHLAPKLKRAGLAGVGLPSHEVERGGSFIPSWVAPLADVWVELAAGVALDDEEPEARIGRALFGPLEAMGLLSEEMVPSESGALHRYFLAIVPVLVSLAEERVRQDRRFRSLIEGLEADEQEAHIQERTARFEAMRDRAEKAFTTDQEDHDG